MCQAFLSLLPFQPLEKEKEKPDTQVTFDLFGSIFPEPLAKRFASLGESELEEHVSERHSKKTKEVTNCPLSTFKGKQKCLKLSWNSLIGFTIKIKRNKDLRLIQ